MAAADPEDPKRFRSDDFDAVVYDGSFPLAFLRPGESVSKGPAHGDPGEIWLDCGDGSDGFHVRKGELLVRDGDGHLHLLLPIEADFEP